MATQIFINLPVKDLKKATTFFTKTGFTFDKQFTDKKASCMIIEKNSIYAMLIAQEYFKTFTKKPISNAKKATEALFAIQLTSRKAVDKMVNNAMKAGAKKYRKDDDYGWMYTRCFEDLDGHQWEVFQMDVKKMPKAKKR